MKSRKSKLSYYRNIINKQVNKGHHVVISLDFKNKDLLDRMESPELGYLYVLTKDNDYDIPEESAEMMAEDPNMAMEPDETPKELSDQEIKKYKNIYRFPAKKVSA